jgi:hypothetical protein
MKGACIPLAAGLAGILVLAAGGGGTSKAWA